MCLVCCARLMPCTSCCILSYRPSLINARFNIGAVTYIDAYSSPASIHCITTEISIGTRRLSYLSLLVYSTQRPMGMSLALFIPNLRIYTTIEASLLGDNFIQSLVRITTIERKNIKYRKNDLLKRSNT